MESEPPASPQRSSTKAETVAPDAAGGSRSMSQAALPHTPSMASAKSKKNPAADAKNMRRIIAEDPEYNLATVPNLNSLCLNQMVNNFDFNTNMYNVLEGNQRGAFLNRISTDVSLKVTGPLIHEEAYWERVCKTRWSLCDISQYAGSWKRMLFERNLEEIVENFVPERTDRTRLEETLPLSAPYVQRLDIKQLLPPVKVEVLKEANPDDASEVETEVEEPPKFDHFDLTPVIQALPNLTELRVTYGVRDCGMNFEWSIFQFTMRDTLLIAKAVASAKQLRLFQLHRSRVDCDRCRVLISHLLDHPNLVELDLSHNAIGDRGARAIGKFLNGHSILTRLDVSNNQIRAAGAQALAHALTKNTTLLRLNIRLNRLLDDGGQAICKALLRNNTLRDVNLAANDMTEPTASILAQVVVENKTVVSLDLSNNRLGPDGGKQLQEGMAENRTLVQMDLRFTECGQEAEFCISQIIERNQELLRSSEIEGKMSGKQSGLVTPELARSAGHRTKPFNIQELGLDNVPVF